MKNHAKLQARDARRACALPMASGTERKVRAMRAALLRWYRRNYRDLPWRRTRDPYAIWVSEVMLQQTQVATVIPYYERFLERFPTVASLAGAPEEMVLSVWSGLGYYRRATALRKAAIAVVDRHHGRVPDDPDELRALPGVGRYTAGAIASVAFGRPEPALDGNVRRVLCRVFAMGGDGRNAGQEVLWKIASTLVQGVAPGDLNQALMELGATVCTTRAPRCGGCPIALRCRGRSLGTPEAFPSPRPHRPTVKVRVAVAVVRNRGRVLVEQPGIGSPFLGTWDLPAVELSTRADGRRAIEAAMEGRHALSILTKPASARAVHSILHRRLALEIFPCRLRGPLVKKGDGTRWIRPESLSETPVSGATRKVLQLALRGSGPVPRR